MPTFAIVLLVILAWLAMTAWNHRRLNRACYAAFAQVYSNSVPSPTFEPSSSYGYPHFKVTFETKPAMEAADRAGLNQELRRRLDELCKHEGQRWRPFRAESGNSHS
jgi:hypothetical protein